MYSIEVSGSAGTQILTFEAPILLKELKVRLGLAHGDFLFSGGKKIADEDLIPFNSQTHKAKCRVLGAVLLKPVNSSASQLCLTPSSLTPSAQMSSSSSSTSTKTKGVLVKGLKPNDFYREDLSDLVTFLDLKKVLVSQGYISDVRSIAFLGKGGKTPLDSDCLSLFGNSSPLITLRAVSTEFANTALDKQQRIVQLKSMVDAAEKKLVAMGTPLDSSQHQFLHLRQLESELTVIQRECAPFGKDGADIMISAQKLLAQVVAKLKGTRNTIT